MFLPLKRYADFLGRSRRMEHWMFQLGQWILFFLLALPLVAVGAATDPGEQTALLDILTIPFAILWLRLVIPNLAVTIRRLHDQDKSGWWLLINFIPFGGFVLLIFMFLDGSPGENEYGPSPKDDFTAETFA
ncbi:DUF805 domain-containing protein [Citromicrobium bathyomarinum]|uniref:DUF805 domain-containing protein n=1 Tax=Citromicrobium bathyomarinum TaxID=72174 RepID=UPI00315B1084